MKRFFSPSSISVFSIDVNYWNFPIHKHNFYELILIEKGKGQHQLNNTFFNYKKGDVFFLSPEDSHNFIVSEQTKFNYLKFTEQIFLEKGEHPLNSKWGKGIKSVISNPNTPFPSDIIAYKNDRKNLFLLYHILAQELDKTCLFSRYIALDIFGSIISIIGRNLHSRNKKNEPLNDNKEKISEILSYIRQNIMIPKNITIKNIANEFNISPNYVSIFIKKHSGMSIQNMISKTKMKAAKRLLTNSRFNITEIAYKLGFTDSSHFSKSFKKHVGKNPKDYRHEKALKDGKS